MARQNLRRAAVLAAVAPLALTACAKTPGTEKPTSTTAAEATSTTAKAAAERAIDGNPECELAEPVKIGVVLSANGQAQIYGAAQDKGVRLAVEQLNARKSGVTYDLTVEDDGSRPDQGTTAFEKLIDDGVTAIVGPTLSNVALTTDPEAQKQGVPVLAVSNTAKGITEIGDYIFRASLTESQVVPPTVEKVKDDFEIETAAIIYGNDDAFTKSGYDVFSQALKAADIEIVSTQTFAKDDTVFTAQLTEIRKAKPDLLVVVALAPAGVPLVKQARRLGIDARIVGGNGFNSPAFAKDVGTAGEGVVVGAAWNATSRSDLNQTFLADFADTYDGAKPDQFAAQAYTGIQLVARAVETACSADRAEVRDAMAELADVPTVLGTFSFTEGRDADHPGVVQQITDGAFSLL